MSTMTPTRPPSWISKRLVRLTVDRYEAMVESARGLTSAEKGDLTHRPGKKRTLVNDEHAGLLGLRQYFATTHFLLPRTLLPALRPPNDRVAHMAVTERDHPRPTVREGQ